MAKRSLKTESVLNTIKERIGRGAYREQPFPSERKLALQLGVSHTTARKAVKEAVANGLLKRSETGRILVATEPTHALQFALICPGESTPFLMDWTKALSIVTNRHAAHLNVYHYVDSHDTLLTDALVAEYDLYFLVAPNPMSRVVSDLVRDRLGRICTIFSDLTALKIPRIDNSSEEGIDLLLDQLQELGHRQIACVNCEDSRQSIRVKRYRNYCENHNLPVITHEETNPTDWISQTRGYRFMNRILNSNTLDATAYLFTSIGPCQGALRACHEKGVKLGSDLSICGFGPSTRARLMVPSVTSLQVPTQETVLNSAVDALLTGGIPLPPENWRPSIFIGESTGPLKNA